MILQVYADQPKVFCIEIGANVGAICVTANVKVFRIGYGHNRSELSFLDVLWINISKKPRRI